MMNHRSSTWAPAEYRACARLAFLFVFLMLAGCGPRTTPEQQVRAVIAAGEAAAEKRDLSGIMDLVSSRYEDAQGGSAVELSRTLRGYFIVNQSVHLLTRVDSIDFPYKDMARVRLTIGTLGNQAGAGETFDFAADVQDVKLELQLERGEWKVTRAAWQAVVRT
jgi:hypothetical protein